MVIIPVVVTTRRLVARTVETTVEMTVAVAATVAKVPDKELHLPRFGFPALKIATACCSKLLPLRHTHAAVAVPYPRPAWQRPWRGTEPSRPQPH